MGDPMKRSGVRPGSTPRPTFWHRLRHPSAVRIQRCHAAPRHARRTRLHPGYRMPSPSKVACPVMAHGRGEKPRAGPRRRVPRRPSPPPAPGRRGGPRPRAPTSGPVPDGRRRSCIPLGPPHVARVRHRRDFLDRLLGSAPQLDAAPRAEPDCADDRAPVLVERGVPRAVLVLEDEAAQDAARAVVEPVPAGRHLARRRQLATPRSEAMRSRMPRPRCNWSRPPGSRTMLEVPSAKTSRRQMMAFLR
jgi:hypothetical protein